ncbi:MAG TPA: GtrA family protein [Candidatus Nanopelagicales bacterium]|nr:GtrA family protein [Candidatus Nanopelagicales bacterium]
MVTTETAKRAHRKEVGGFLVVGVLAVVIDFSLFNALMLAAWPVWAANAVALFVSMTFAFVGNYKWTFAHREIKSLFHAYSAFAGINLLTVVFIEAVVVAAEVAWQPNGLWLNIIKAVATAIATVGRFFAYRKWVFF